MAVDMKDDRLGMSITIRDENGVVFEFDGKTVSMPTEQAQRSFVFYALMGSLSALCHIPQMHEIPDEEPEIVRQ